MRAWRREWHELTGGYALDALEPAEAAAFEHHMSRCRSCGTEARGLRETAARLGVAAAMPPPDGMQERVLAATYRTRQLPPLISPEPLRTRRRRPGIRLSLAIGAAVIAAVLAVTQVITWQHLTTARASSQAVTAVLTAPDARIGTAAGESGGTVTVIASAAKHEAIITTAGMPALSGSLVYQAWVMGQGGARSAGLLGPAPGGGTDLILARGTRPGDRIGITIEPAGGTRQPTTTPLVNMPLPT